MRHAPQGCGYREISPRFLGALPDGLLQLRQAQKVHVGILLVVVLLGALWQLERVQRIVGGRVPGGEIGGVVPEGSVR